MYGCSKSVQYKAIFLGCAYRVNENKKYNFVVAIRDKTFSISSGLSILYDFLF